MMEVDLYLGKWDILTVEKSANCIKSASQVSCFQNCLEDQDTNFKMVSISLSLQVQLKSDALVLKLDGVRLRAKPICSMCRLN